MKQEEIGTRIRLYYFFYFCIIGIFEPFLTLYFRHLGFSGRQIGLLAGAPGLIHATFPFLWTAFADSQGQRNRVFLLTTWVSVLSFLFLLFSHQFIWLLGAILLFSVFRSPLVPLLNAFALQYGKERGTDFSSLRVWGSLGYIVAAILFGKLIDLSSPRTALYGGLAALLLCGISWGKGVPWKGGRRGDFRRAFREVFARKGLIVFLLVSNLVWMSWSPYSNFFTIHMEDLGISKGFAGWAWAIGVLSEVVIMFGWRRIASVLSPHRLFTLALILLAIRWFLCSLARGPLSILPVQLLHGITFAIFYLSSMAILDEMVPPGLRTTSQGVYSAFTFGLGSFLGGLGSGLLFDHLGMIALFRISSLLTLLALWLHIAFGRRLRLDRLDGRDGPGEGDPRSV